MQFNLFNLSKRKSDYDSIKKESEWKQLELPFDNKQYPLADTIKDDNIIIYDDGIRPTL